MTGDELDVLLQDRLNLSRSDVIAALKLLPAYRTSTRSITAEETCLLDAAGLPDDPGSYAQLSIETIANMAGLVKSAYTVDEVASGLSVDAAQIEQRRQARSLWAIDDNGSWRYPKMQFDVVESSGRSRLNVVRSLDQVLRALPTDVHPLAVAGFLLTPQSELAINGRPSAVRDWLGSGAAVGPVLHLVDLREWVWS